LSPPALDSIVEQCLSKDPDDRWQSARDVERTLQWVRSGTAPGSTVASVSARSRGPWVIALAALLTALSAVGWTLATRQAPRVPHRRVFSIALPRQIQIAGASAISPDGSHFAFVGLGADGPPSLYVMSLGDGMLQKLADTQYASLPFWSPAGDRLGFVANGKLSVISVSGGPPRVLASAPNGRGGSWSRDGTILFVPTPNSPVLRISDSGGVPVSVTTLDLASGVIGHRWPTFVDDRHFVFTIQAGKTDAVGLYLGSLDSSEVVRLSPQYSNSQFVNGQLLFVVNGMIAAQQLDVAQGRLVGKAVDIAGPTAFSGGLGFESFSAAADGSMLAYAPGAGSGATMEIQWLDRTKPTAAASQLTTTTDLTRYDAYFEELSPDGATMAVAQFRAGTPDLWLFDFRRDTFSRFTFDDGTEINPVWSPNSAELMFSSNRVGFYNMYRKRRDESNVERLFRKADSPQYVTDWSRDGNTIIYTNVDSTTVSDIWSANADGRGEPKVVIRTAYNEYAGRLSPDGQWLAFTSDESGQPEVYVQRFPSGTERTPVTSQGGSEPQWRADGRELFYVGANRVLMAVPISFSPLNIGRPVKVHETAIDLSIGSMHARHYTVDAHGQTFLASIPRVGPPTTIVMNWQAGLRQ
jgi:Tol biopolymer transport system component